MDTSGTAQRSIRRAARSPLLPGSACRAIDPAQGLAAANANPARAGDEPLLPAPDPVTETVI
jgi:hypothetical protein